MTTERVYTPEGSVRKPLQLFREMIRDVASARYIAWRIFVRDIRARYRQTALGYVWAFLPPLALAATLTIASDAKLLNVGVTDIPYAAFVVFGVVVWQTFTESVTGPILAITEARTMVTRVSFPREALVMAKVADVIFNLAVKAVLVVAVFAWFGVAVPKTAALTPLALGSVIVVGVVIGVLLAPLAAVYHDFSRGMTILLGLWFFFTPIAYPAPTEGVFARLVRWNPLTPLVTTIRELTYVGTVSQPTEFMFITVAGVLAALVAWVIYRIAMPLVIERMSA